MILKGIPVGLGTAVFGTSIPQELADKILDTYAALGGRVIDTADSYAFWNKGRGGDSERVIGNWLERRDRSAFTIMTKIGSQPVDLDKDRDTLEGLSPPAVHRAVSASLARLKTHYLDILLTHHDDKNTPLLDTWKCFSELAASGKVKWVGVSNYLPQRMEELARLVRDHALAPIDCVQLKYSLLDPVKSADFGKLVLLDAEMKDTLKRLVPRAVIFGYSPLLGGKTLDKMLNNKWPPEYDSIPNREKIRAIQAKARELHVTPSACLLKQIADEGIWPITATAKPERLEDNLKLFRKET